MHLVLAAVDSKDALQHELGQVFPGSIREIRSGLFACELALSAGARVPFLAFARQFVPDAREVEAASIRSWASLLVESVAGVLPDHQTWSLHVVPFKEVVGSSRTGARAWRRHLVRYLRQHEGVFVLSVAKAPLPFQEQQVVSGFPGGNVPLAVDKQAPSRAFAKLVEAERRLGRYIAAHDRCVDLGASPGSWTYVAVRRGARVTAVDRTDLREDLMQHRNVGFERGDAFRFEPASPVDWLLCDVIASAERSAERLLEWLRRKWCRHFVVTLKVDHAGSGAVLARLKRELPDLTSELGLLRLCANKKEVCAFGTIA